MSQSNFIAFPPGSFGGAVAVHVFATLSSLALFSILAMIFWNALRRLIRPKEDHGYVFFSTQLGKYAACLLIANFCTCAAGLIGITWVVKRGITEGAVCRLQAFLMQLGNGSLAYFSTFIAIHTFSSLVLKKKQSTLICSIIIAVGWIFSVIMASSPFFIHSSSGPIYGADGLLCGVRTNFPNIQFVFHLLPIFIASLVSTTLLSIVFFVSRGNLTFNGGPKINLCNHRVLPDANQKFHHMVSRLAESMLWFPIAYTLLLVPYSVTRVLSIYGVNVPLDALIFAFVCWYALGIADILLLYNTFRAIIPAFDKYPGGKGSSCHNTPHTSKGNISFTGGGFHTRNKSDTLRPLLLNSPGIPPSDYTASNSSRTSDRLYLPRPVSNMEKMVEKSAPFPRATSITYVVDCSIASPAPSASIYSGSGGLSESRSSSGSFGDFSDIGASVAATSNHMINVATSSVPIPALVIDKSRGRTRSAEIKDISQPV